METISLQTMSYVIRKMFFLKKLPEYPLPSVAGGYWLYGAKHDVYIQPRTRKEAAVPPGSAKKVTDTFSTLRKERAAAACLGIRL
jgi:hypothetical protein